jgi:NADP-dependent 3-hydroxy acid dehydrogenase YdfG
VKLALSNPETIVFAGARNPEGSKDFAELSKRYPGRFFAVKLVSADKESNERAISLIQEKVGRLDVIIANAGKSNLGSIDRDESIDTFWY